MKIVLKTFMQHKGAQWHLRIAKERERVALKWNSAKCATTITTAGRDPLSLPHITPLYLSSVLSPYLPHSFNTRVHSFLWQLLAGQTIVVCACLPASVPACLFHSVLSALLCPVLCHSVLCFLWPFCHLFAVCIQRADEWPLEVSTTLYEITLSMRQLHKQLCDADKNKVPRTHPFVFPIIYAPLHTPSLSALLSPPLSLSREFPLAVDFAATMSCKKEKSGSLGANLWHSNKRQLPVTVAAKSMRTTLMVCASARLPKCLLNKRKLMMRKKRRWQF